MCLIKSIPHDSAFEIITFGNPLNQISFFSNLQPCSRESIFMAVNLTNSLFSTSDYGGTHIIPAITTALQYSQRDGKPIQIVLVTDGEVDNPDQVLNYVQLICPNIRIACLGIGNEANRELISGIATSSGGFFDFACETDVAEKAVQLFKKTISPVISQISVQTENANFETFPFPIPPLYGSSQTVVLKSEGFEENSNFLITGKSGNIDIEFPIEIIKNEDEKVLNGLFASQGMQYYEKDSPESAA